MLFSLLLFVLLTFRYHSPATLPIKGLMRPWNSYFTQREKKFHAARNFFSRCEKVPGMLVIPNACGFCRGQNANLYFYFCTVVKSLHPSLLPRKQLINKHIHELRVFITLHLPFTYPSLSDPALSFRTNVRKPDAFVLVTLPIERRTGQACRQNREG